MQRAGRGVSDPVFTIEDVIAEGDKVAVRLTSSATHSGTFMGKPATGKRYTIQEIHIFRFREGQVTEHWHEFDKLSLMQQLEPDPAPDGADR
jgi:predicted ester cyclase